LNIWFDLLNGLIKVDVSVLAYALE